MSLVLRALPGSKNGYKTLIAAEYCGVKVGFETGLSVQEPVFLFSYNPINELLPPVLETPDGPLVESNAMARYITSLNEGNTLCGSSVYELTLIEQWINFALKETDEVLTSMIDPEMRSDYPNYAPFEAVNTAKTKVSLRILNLRLSKNPHYLVGNFITLADIIMVCDLHLGFTRFMPKSFTSLFPNVERYFWRLVNEPEFRKVMGDVKQTEVGVGEISNMDDPLNVKV